MAIAHCIQCAHDYCWESSVRADFYATDREELARDHRLSLVEDGWRDIEGRDYCPDHGPDRD